MMARWIRLSLPPGPAGPLDFDAACAGLAAAQAKSAPPILLWGEGASSYPFALIVPRRLAPGKRLRWPSWGLAPAVAAYRQFGVPAYLNDGDLWLHGRKIAGGLVEAIGECPPSSSRPSACASRRSTAGSSSTPGRASRKC